MSMNIEFDLTECNLKYHGEVIIDNKEYSFEASWNDVNEEVIAIYWPWAKPKRLMKAEKRIVQLISKVIKEDAKVIIV